MHPEQRTVTEAGTRIRHLPALDTDSTLVTLAGRISGLVEPGCVMVVIAPDELTRDWVAGFIRTMVPSTTLGRRAGLPPVLVEATSESRRLNVRATGDLRTLIIYTPDDFDFCRSNMDLAPLSVTAAELLAGVVGVPDWAHAAVAGGAAS